MEINNCPKCGNINNNMISTIYSPSEGGLYYVLRCGWCPYEVKRYNYLDAINEWNKKETKKMHKCPVCNIPLNASMFCVKCCCKWTIKPLEEELKKDDFIAWGNYETIEEAEIEWSDIEDVTELPIDDQSIYYDAGGISTMDVIKAKLTEDQFKGFLLGNIIKYSCRLNHKDNPTRDAEKVANYSKILSEL